MMNTEVTIDSLAGTRSRVKGTGLLFMMFCAWVFVLLFRPQDIFPFLAPLRPALLTGLATMAFVVLHHAQLKEPRFFAVRQIRYYTYLVLVMIVGVPFSFYPRLSFMTIFTQQVNVILFVYIFYKVVNSTDKLRTVLFLACAGSGLYSAYSLIRGSLESDRLFFGEMFDPNDLAFFAISFLPLNILLVKRQNPLWMRLGGLACFLVEVALVLQTGSRGGFLALGVVALAMLFVRGGTITPIIKTSVVLFLVVVVGYAAVNVDRYRSLADIDQDYNLSSETGRLAIWKIGIRTMFSHPVTGVGVGCFPLAVSLDRKARGLDSTRWQTAHNSVILIGTETGVAGLVLFLAMSVGVMKTFVRIRKVPDDDMLRSIGETGFLGFVGLFVACMFLSQAYSFYWAFYVALSAVATRLAERPSPNPSAGVRV